MRSCERPLKRSARDAGPSSVSKRYSLSIRTQGSSRRRCASSSPRRVSAFSASSSSSRAASHSSRVPILWSVILPLLFGATFLPSFLDELLQADERFVPSLRNVLEIGSRRFHLFQLELPDALAATPHIRDEPSRGEHVQVFGNGLSCNSRSGGQPGNRERALGAQSGHQRQPGFITERSKHRRSARDLAPAGAMKRHIARCSPVPQPSPRRSFEVLQHALPPGCDRSLTRPR